MREIAILLGMVVRGLPAMLLQPWEFPLFWVLVVLVAFQYRRVADTERRIYGVTKNNPIWQLGVACLFGLGAGLVASMLMAILGVSLSGAGVTWLLPLALLLLAINPRLMCFSYAGGIIAVSHLLFGWPKVYVPAIMALVAVLHITESLLIYLRGSACTTPVVVRNEEKQATRTGFLMQGFWPLPLLLLFVITLPPGAPREGLMEMPTWWPLIVPPAEVISQENAVFTLFPVAAVLGYGDLAARHGPDLKAHRSAWLLLGYSVVLLGLSVLSSHLPVWTWLAALWGPLGHELVVRHGARGEFEAQAAIRPAADGLTILDVLPRSGAARAGLQTNDVLVLANGRPVLTTEALSQILAMQEEGMLPVVVRRGDATRELQVELRPIERGSQPSLGIIPVPPEGAPPHMEIRMRGNLAGLLSRIRAWLARS